jgi:hypothetical protein
MCPNFFVDMYDLRENHTRYFDVAVNDVAEEFAEKLQSKIKYSILKCFVAK